MKILIGDHHQLFRAGLRLLLEPLKDGVAFGEAGTFNELVEQCRGGERYDLILMDLGLPILNGWQATQQIKATPGTRHIPIIALTAYVLTEDHDKSIAAGCDDYESKPINFARLQAKIQSLLA